MHLLQSLPESLSGGPFAQGDFPFPGVHPMREVRGSLSGEMHPFQEEAICMRK